MANEGEPNSYNQPDSVDPVGSISIIDLSQGVAAATHATAGFEAFDGPDERAELIAAGVRIFGPNASVAQDLEPEYIAISPDGSTSYVTLQENNALAEVDIATATVTAIRSFGYKDHNGSSNGLDASDRDTPGSSNHGLINIRNWPVLGMYQPDAIATYQVDGQTYLVTANEGDARDYPGFAEEARAGSLVLDAASFAAQGFAEVSTGPAGLRNNDNLGRLNVTTTRGNEDADPEFEHLYAFGGRSFSIWNAGGEQVYDSGNAFEQITAAAFPASFNAGHDDNTFDSRSDNKGPEPEAVMLAEIAGRTYAFIGLERIGGIMLYDVTNPGSPAFLQYINHRDFSAPSGSDAALDLGLEDLKFVPADESPTGTPLVLSANEISGTVTVFAIHLSHGARLTDRGVLEILGTPANDSVAIQRVGSNIQVTATFLGPAVSFPLASIESIHVILGAGNDRLTVDRNVTLPLVVEGWSGHDFVRTGSSPATALGGLGNDILIADRAASVLVGGRGSDLLIGGRARNVLIGGSGRDILLGGSAQDLLIGGRTAYDLDLTSLRALRSAWSGPGTFSDRKQALQNGVDSAHGQVRLVAGRTVRDDQAVDLLLGGADLDWFFTFDDDVAI